MSCKKCKKQSCDCACNKPNNPGPAYAFPMSSFIWTGEPVTCNGVIINTGDSLDEAFLAVLQRVCGFENIPGQDGADGADGQDGADGLGMVIATLTTTSTDLGQVLYEVTFDPLVKAVGYYEYEVISKRGNEAGFWTNNGVSFNVNATQKMQLPNIPNNTDSAIIRDAGDDTGFVRVVSDAVNNKFQIVVDPQSSASTIWKIIVKVVEIP